MSVGICQKRVTCSEKEATQGVNFPGCWECLISIPKSVADRLRRGCSHAKTPFALQSSTILRERVFMAWKISQPKATEMSTGWSGVDCLPGTSGDSERTELKAKSYILYFLEEEKMSCHHFEFRYFLECHFNLILFKQLLNPLNKYNFN